jgi:hypothetical protein
MKPASKKTPSRFINDAARKFYLMKRELKFFIATTLIAAVAGGVPVYLQRRKDQEIQALRSRPPAQATRVLRQALARSTEVRVHLGVGDTVVPDFSRTPTTLALQLGKPALILRDREMQNLIAGLHAERAGKSAWRPRPGPYPGAALTVTALEVYADGQCIADVRAGLYGLRWYTPLKYKGDAPLLPESERYLEQMTTSE